MANHIYSVYVRCQDGDAHRVESPDRKKIERLYDSAAELNPLAVSVYHYGHMSKDYLPIEGKAFCHLTKGRALEAFRDVQGTLKANKMPLYGVEDEEVRKLMHLDPDRWNAFEVAWIAFHVTERQGGCWVFE